MEVLYEDNHLIIVNKSVGEIVQGDKTGDEPLPEIIKRYLDMGGKLITLGSDAHAKENASYGFDKAKEMLNSLGVFEAYYFKNRQPIKYNL